MAVKPCHTLICAIDGQGVLHQVVGPDGEEIDLAGEGLGHDRGRGHLDHHSHFEIPIEGQTFLGEVVHDVADVVLGLAELF